MHVDEFCRIVEPWLNDTGGPVGAHLHLAISQAITTGLLPPGVQFPPERIMAGALHVSRPTVSAVMSELRGSGLVTSRQGSGTWVNDSGLVPDPIVPFAELVMPGTRIDLAAATAPDATLLPPVRVDTTDLFGVQPANGLTPGGLQILREHIAHRYQSCAPDIGAANVVITSGAHGALGLLLAAKVEPGSAVVVDETTYGGLIDLIRSNGAHAVGVAHDDGGPDPADLSRLISKHKPAMIVLVSPVHSPTGIVTNRERAQELAKILRSAPGHVVLDETYADLAFGSAPRSIGHDAGTAVIRVGSLSKSLWTGLRIGWIVADADFCADLTRHRFTALDLGPSIPAQLFARALFDDFDDVVKIRRSQLRAKAELLIDGLAAALPTWRVTPPGGGLTLWVQLPDIDGARFCTAAASHGVAVLPGSACRFDRADDPHIRICFDRPPEVLAEAIDRLACVNP